MTTRDDASRHAEGVKERTIHIAARIEDRMHRWRERRGRARGLVPTVVAYRGYGSVDWVRILARVVLMKPTASDAAERAERVRGWRSFFSIPAAADREAIVTIGGETHTVPIDRGGVVDARVPVRLSPGWHTATIRSTGSDAAAAEIFVVDPAERFGVISDVDDTIMVTALPRPLLAAWNTFVLDEHARRPVTGMAVLFDRIRRQHPGAPVIYLSTGAWNVAPTLRRFLGRNLYPAGPILLTDWGPTHDRLFRSGREHKRQELRRLATEFPEVRWLLFGDDGQHDEEIYGEFAREFPRNVAAVAIRQLTPGEAILAGGRAKAAERERESPARWFYGPDGSALFEQLSRAGVISTR